MRRKREFLGTLTDEDLAEVLAAMRDVSVNGLAVSRKLRGDLWEVRATGRDSIYRVLFASEGRRGLVLLALDAFSKKTRKTPLDRIETAERRLADWRSRGASSAREGQ